MLYRLRGLIAPAEDQGLDPSTNKRQLVPACNSSSRVSVPLLWPPKALHIHHTQAHTQNKTMKTNFQSALHSNQAASRDSEKQ